MKTDWIGRSDVKIRLFSNRSRSRSRSVLGVRQSVFNSMPVRLAWCGLALLLCYGRCHLSMWLNSYQRRSHQACISSPVSGCLDRHGVNNESTCRAHHLPLWSIHKPLGHMLPCSSCVRLCYLDLTTVMVFLLVFHPLLNTSSSPVSPPRCSSSQMTPRPKLWKIFADCQSNSASNMNCTYSRTKLVSARLQYTCWTCSLPVPLFQHCQWRLHCPKNYQETWQKSVLSLRSYVVECTAYWHVIRSVKWYLQTS